MASKKPKAAKGKEGLRSKGSEADAPNTGTDSDSDSSGDEGTDVGWCRACIARLGLTNRQAKALAGAGRTFWLLRGLVDGWEGGLEELLGEVLYRSA